MIRWYSITDVRTNLKYKVRAHNRDEAERLFDWWLRNPPVEVEWLRRQYLPERKAR